MKATPSSPCAASAVLPNLSPSGSLASQAACPAQEAALWSVVEVCTWPAVGQAAAPAAPCVPATTAAVWPRKRRWPDVDDLGPVEWLQVSQPLSPSGLRGSH